MTSRALSSLLFIGLCTSACSNLSPITAELCGNRIVETSVGEDCDGGDNCGTLDDDDAACRFMCSAEQACPLGFGCGTDSICRQHSGVFELVSETGAVTLFAQAADIDGDGRLDLFRTSNDTTEAQFFADNFDIAATTTLARVPSDVAPLLAPLTFDDEGIPDARADIAIDVESATNFGSGLAVYRSQADRSLAPTAYSTLGLGGEAAFGLSINAISPASAEEVIAFVLTPNGTGLVGLSDNDLQPHNFKIQNKPLHPAFITGTATGDLIGAGSPCDDLVWTAANAAPGTDTKLFIYSPCVTNLETESAIWKSDADDVIVVDLPYPLFSAPSLGTFLPANYRSNVFVTDKDGDGDDDIVVLLDSNDGKPVWWIENTTGPLTWTDPNLIQQVTRVAIDEFYTDKAGDDPVDVLLAGCDFDPDAQDLPGVGFPLAITDLNEDGAIDFVSDDSIWVSRPRVVGMGKTYHQVDGCLNWGTVAIADFDGNGTKDIAATRLDDPGIEVALNSGDGAFTRNVISTQRTVFFLSAGDYDGDFVTDLSFLEIEDISFEENEDIFATDTLSVAFGAASGGFEAPVLLGTLPRARALISGRVEGGDATDDMFVIAQNTKRELAIALFSGDGARQIVSPYLFLQGQAPKTRPTQILELTAGRFFSDVPATGMAVLTQTNDEAEPLRLWAVEAEGEAELQAISQEAAGIDFCFECVLAALDLDGDAQDEMVVLGEGIGKIFRSESSEAQFFGDAVDIAGIDNLCFYSKGLGGEPLRPAIRDVDGDGDLDLGAIAFECDSGSAVAVVFWNNGSGTLSRANASLITLVGDGKDDAIQAIGFMNLDKDPQLELVLSEVTLNNFGLFDEGLNFVFNIAPGDPTRDFTEGLPLSVIDDNLRYPAEVFIPGDFNGDGVEDLIVTSYDTYSVLRGVPVR